MRWVPPLRSTVSGKCMSNGRSSELGQMTVAVRSGPKIPFEAKRQPFLPRLLVSHDTPLCDAFLSAFRKDFLAQHRDGDSLFKEPPMAIGHWVAWPSEHGPEAFRTRIDVAEMDLDRNGKKQLLVHVAQPFNWRHNSYSLLVSQETTTDGLANEIIAFEKLPPLEQQTASLRTVAPPDFPSLWNWGAFDGEKSPFRVLLFQGAAYLYTFADGVIGGGGAPAGTANLRRIRADGSLDLRCQASVVPRAGALPPPSWLSQGGQPDTVAVPTEVVEWMKVIRGIQGTEGRWAGTLHALNSLIILSTYTWHDTLVRPWDSGDPLTGLRRSPCDPGLLSGASIVCPGSDWPATSSPVSARRCRSRPLLRVLFRGVEQQGSCIGCRR